VLAHWSLWLTVIVSGLIIWRTRIHLLWLLAAGAVLGALGLI
jgi:chromate transporter